MTLRSASVWLKKYGDSLIFVLFDLKRLQDIYNGCIPKKTLSVLLELRNPHPRPKCGVAGFSMVVEAMRRDCLKRKT